MSSTQPALRQLLLSTFLGNMCALRVARHVERTCVRPATLSSLIYSILFVLLPTAIPPSAARSFRISFFSSARPQPEGEFYETRLPPRPRGYGFGAPTVFPIGKSDNFSLPDMTTYLPVPSHPRHALPSSKNCTATLRGYLRPPRWPEHALSVVIMFSLFAELYGA